MGIIVGLPRSGGSEKDLQLNFGKVMAQQTEMRHLFFLLNGIRKVVFS